MEVLFDKQGGGWAIGTPSADSTPAADPFVQQLLQENAELRVKLERLTSINDRLGRKVKTLRDGVALISDQAKRGG